MKRSTRNWLIGGGVLAAIAGGVWYYEKYKAPSVVPTGQLTTGTPVTQFTNGQIYTFAASVPSGVTSALSLVNALAAAGWTGIGILFFGPGPNPGVVPGGLEANTSSYVAIGKFNGQSGPVPNGVVALQGAVNPTNAALLATG
jgi:hypothetical protein